VQEIFKMDVDMNKLAEALKDEDYCQAMEELEFMILSYSEEDEECYFINEAQSLIVRFDVEKNEFQTFPRANQMSLLNENENK
jgi:hypothetical protein